MSNVVEAVLLAAGRPVTVEQIQELFEEHERPPAEDVIAALEGLAQRYEATGIELQEVASGLRFPVRRVRPGGPSLARTPLSATPVRCSRPSR